MVRIPEIPEGEFEFTFVRSSGPGGQNVNKVNSKAVLRWAVLASPSLSGEEKAMLAARLPLTVSGDLVVSSDRHRDQARNREECLQRVRELVRKAFHREKPRKKTRPSRASVLRRKEGKKRNSQKKAARSFKGRE